MKKCNSEYACCYRSCGFCLSEEYRDRICPYAENLEEQPRKGEDE